MSRSGSWADKSPALGDIDGDGKIEVCWSSWDNNLRCHNGEDGTLVWKFKADGPLVSNPVIGDIDGDGKVEVCVGSDDTHLYCLNGEDGSELWSFPTEAEITSTPAIADVNGDGLIEVCFGSDDHNLYCVRGGGKTPDASLLPWPKFKGDIWNTGFFAPVFFSSSTWFIRTHSNAKQVLMYIHLPKFPRVTCFGKWASS